MSAVCWFRGDICLPDNTRRCWLQSCLVTIAFLLLSSMSPWNQQTADTYICQEFPFPNRGSPGRRDSPGEATLAFLPCDDLVTMKSTYLRSLIEFLSCLKRKMVSTFGDSPGKIFTMRRSGHGEIYLPKVLNRISVLFEEEDGSQLLWQQHHILTWTTKNDGRWALKLAELAESFQNLFLALDTQGVDAAADCVWLLRKPIHLSAEPFMNRSLMSDYYRFFWKLSTAMGPSCINRTHLVVKNGGLRLNRVFNGLNGNFCH